MMSLMPQPAVSAVRRLRSIILVAELWRSFPADVHKLTLSLGCVTIISESSLPGQRHIPGCRRQAQAGFARMCYGCPMANEPDVTGRDRTWRLVSR